MASHAIHEAYNHSCSGPVLLSYAAGLMTAVAIWLIASTFDFERRASIRESLLQLPSWRPMPELTKKYDDQEQSENEKQIAFASSRKHFHFRERQWHEPPEADCACLDHYDYAQKELKNAGDVDLAWKTTWLDLNVERDLLYQYLSLVSKEKEYKSLPDSEKNFYKALQDSLWNDINEVEDAQTKHDRDHGKNWEDVWLMRRWLESVQDKMAGLPPRKVERMERRVLSDDEKPGH